MFNDRCATGLTVPGDVSVIGYDDSRLARLSHVDLTTVAQNIGQMSHLAVTRVNDRLDGTDVGERELVVPPHLVVRSTTAPPTTTPSRPAATTASSPEAVSLG